MAYKTQANKDGFLHVVRTDTGRLDKVIRTASGFLKAPAYVAKVGVLTYATKDGTVRELVLPGELFNKDSMDTLKGVPLTNDHPLEKELNPDNVCRYQRGYTSDTVGPEDLLLRTDVTIVDGQTIKDAESGKDELSCGYTCDLEVKPGIWNGEPYDAIQRNRRYNHVAVVDRGRAGHDARIHLDADDAGQIEDTHTKEDSTMAKLKIKDKEHEVPQEVADCIKDMKDEIADLKAKKKDAEEGVEKAKADSVKLEQAHKDAQTALQARIDSHAAEITTLKAHNDGAAIATGVKARREIERVAERILSTEQVAKLDSMTDLEIMKAVILAHSPDAKTRLDSADEVYVKARFDAAVELISSKSGADALGEILARTRHDVAGEENVAEKARQEQSKRSQDAWKTSSEKK